MRRAGFFAAALWVVGCGGGGKAGSDAGKVEPEAADLQKIEFALGRVNAGGLVGPPDGLRALSYEFCVPDRPAELAEVQHLDPSVQLMRGARGRIGCEADEVLCLGSTHQPEWRNVLTNLARLPYVRRIAEAHFEH